MSAAAASASGYPSNLRNTRKIGQRKLLSSRTPLDSKTTALFALPSVSMFPRALPLPLVSHISIPILLPRVLLLFFAHARASAARTLFFLSPLSKHLASIGLATSASTSSARQHEAGNGVAYSTLRVGCSLSLSLSLSWASAIVFALGVREALRQMPGAASSPALWRRRALASWLSV